MGSGQSRATHFQPPAKEADDDDDDFGDEHHISISNKMVERLVEDATLAGGAAAASGAVVTSRGDYKEKIFMEKLKCMDENHSERCGITVEDINATAARIELRTANMVSPEPVCEECKEQVIDCYIAAERPSDIIRCWDTVGAFTKCVQDAATTRLRARTQKEAREHARRERHVAHAREHALKDLAPPREGTVP
ncbi:uncharacterized protein LOC135071298 [Ostrinia nubilalis]|uniref:uncharacterized protein LOC114362997 n=1 Tax=Ostrinia furnacalis TaxID=93504 RepID=UPI00103B80FC|nr:uncharacterized protein LOC114362997 [Ostrinia furnacalis]